MEDANRSRLTARAGVTGGRRILTALRAIATAALLVATQVCGAAPTVTAATVGHAGATGDFTSVTMADDGENGDATASDGVFTAQVPVYTNDLPRYRFTYTLTAPTTEEEEEEDVGTTPTTLFINELMASNSTTILDPQGDADDWIELINTGTEAIDLGGMYLSDKTASPLKWQFPAGTTIDAEGYLLIWADDDSGDSPGLHTNFKLSAGGESVVLSDVDARNNVVIDSVDFPLQTTDVSYGRSPEATGAFQALDVASPGRATPTVPEIAIVADGPVTEGGTATFSVTAAPAPTADLTVTVSVTQGTNDNYLPATLPTSVAIASGTTAATLSVAIPDDTTDEPNGVLTVTVATGTGYTVSATAGSASATIRDDDANPAASAVVINELMASNSNTNVDPQGDADDWIELMNTSSAAIDLSGMYLSDDRANAKKWQFPAGTTIAAGGYLLVWADNDTDDTPGLHANFKLSAKGESVVLSDTDANGNTLTDAVDFPALATDSSYGRVPDGTGPFQIISSASPGAALPTLPTVTITSDGPATEGGSASFTVAVAPASTSELTVNVSITQGSGQDYLPTSPPTTVTVAANAEKATLQVTLPDDAADEPNGVITATLTSGTGYLIGSPAAASTTARDNDGGPAVAAVAVNELMASNKTTINDPQGDADDWIELTNTTGAAIDLGGKYLSDDLADPKKWQFPAGTTIAAGAYLLVWADDDNGDSPGLHTNFKLSAKGEAVVLSDTDANGNTLMDAVNFAALGEDEAYGRMPNGSGSFRTLSATPGAANLSLPALAIEAGGTATEGGTATFTITADPAPTADLAVDVSVTQTAGADFLPATPPDSVTVPTGATRATLAVALPDDAVDEPNATITASIVENPTRYDVTVGSASLRVRDNDLPPPLTAEFVGMPAEHDGSKIFRFELRFSTEFDSAGLRTVLKDAAFRVANGTVREATRVTAGKNRRWTIGVRPDSYRAVTVELPATTDCTAHGAVCASDGRPLSNGNSATVEGLPPLTAEFAGMPAEHDGAGLIRCEIRFSEEFQGPPGLLERLRDEALAVTNGAVHELKRATPGRNRVWEVAVRPEAYGDVTVALPATTDCEAANAVCAADGRPLANGNSATVSGPPPPLTAEFVGIPAEHDGSKLFRFELRFSEEFASAGLRRVLKDAAFRVTNGTVREATRVTAGKNRYWTIGVRPDSYRAVTVELPATTDCTADGAVCTDDGRPLSNGNSATVEGLPPLTAEFADMPSEHDGADLIRFEIRFSEEFQGPPGLLERLRDEALAVTNGAVHELKRATPGRNRVWEVAVRPEAYGDVTVALPATTDCEAANAVCAADGRPLANGNSATVSGPPPPLTAEFVGIPAEHDGSKLFRFELRFSEEFASAGLRRVLKDAAFRVTNGSVREATRATPGENQRWTIGVRPDSYRAVTVELPVTTECTAEGAICASDGRPLSNGNSATVAGLPPLTAEFVDMPAEHDGSKMFRFELRFSEEFAGAGLRRVLKDAAFRVTNGAVREAGRMTAGENRRWRIGVRPDSAGDVTVELPATTDCDAAGAICATDGRPLSNGSTATVAGPSIASAHAMDLLQGPLAVRVTRDEGIDQPLPVVARRATAVAAEIRHGSGPPPAVRVRVSAGNEVVELDAELRGTTVADAAEAPGFRKSVYVASAPRQLVRADATVSVQVDPDNALDEADETDNELSVDFAALRVTEAPLFAVRVVALESPGQRFEVPRGDHAKLFAETLALLPVGARRIEPGPPLRIGTDATPREMLDLLHAAWNRDAEASEFYHGLYRVDHAFEGLALVGGRVAVSPVADGVVPEAAGWTVAHGFAHNFGLSGASGQTVATTYGWSSARQRFFSLFDQEIMAPMGGPSLFIAPAHYRRAMAWFEPTPDTRVPTGVDNPAVAVTADGSLALTGGIDASGAWYLYSAERSPRPPRARSEGAYTAVLYDGNGMPVLTQTLRVAPLSVGLGGGWSLRVPIAPGAAHALRIWGEGGDLLLDVDL